MSSPLFRRRCTALVGLMLVSGVLLVVPPSTDAHRSASSLAWKTHKTAAEFIAAGQDVPGVDSTLPVCPRFAPDPGFPLSQKKPKLQQQLWTSLRLRYAGRITQLESFRRTSISAPDQRLVIR